MAATAPPASAAETGWVNSTLRRMTLEEKVGQLFTTRVYGESADTTDPDAVHTNTSFLGVDNAARAVDCRSSATPVRIGTGSTCLRSGPPSLRAPM